MCEESVCFWVDSVVGNPAHYRFPVPFFPVTSQVIVASYLLSACIYLFLLYVYAVLPTPVQYHPLEMLRDASNKYYYDRSHVVIKFTIEQRTVNDSEVLHIPSLERTHRHHIPESVPWVHAPFNSSHTVHSAKFVLGAVCQYLLKTEDIITHHRTKHGY